MCICVTLGCVLDTVSLRALPVTKPRSLAWAVTSSLSEYWGWFLSSPHWPLSFSLSAPTLLFNSLKCLASPFAVGNITWCLEMSLLWWSKNALAGAWGCWIALTGSCLVFLDVTLPSDGKVGSRLLRMEDVILLFPSYNQINHMCWLGGFCASQKLIFPMLIWIWYYLNGR